MRTCPRCSVPRPDSEFKFKIAGKPAVRSYCNVCRKKVRREHYNKFSGPYKERAIARRNEVIIKYCQWLTEHPCVDCGEDDIVVLEPDHQRDKVGKVSRMINHGRPWDFILTELAKCEVRCSNCHTRKTARDQKWTRLTFQESRIRSPIPVEP